MDIFVMRYVIAVAEYKKFSLAAQACYVGQPALSQQISKLEKELGVTLFNRNKHEVTLTEAGREFVKHSKEILQRVNALQAEMSNFAGLCKGTLNVGVITSLQCIDFGGMLSSFFAKYPNISININQSGTYDLINYLNERTIDVAFMNYPTTKLPASICFCKLGTDDYSLAVSKKHHLSRKKEVKLSDLKNEKFIFHQAGQVAFDLCMRACQESGFEPHIVCRSQNPSISLHMVQGGLGIAFLPSEEFKNRKVEDIVEVHIIDKRITKEVGIAWRNDNKSQLVERIAKFAQEWVSK